MKPGNYYLNNYTSEPFKKKSPVERIIFFNGAVFATDIALLVIDLKVPIIKGAIADHKFFWYQQINFLSSAVST